MPCTIYTIENAFALITNDLIIVHFTGRFRALSFLPNLLSLILESVLEFFFFLGFFDVIFSP